MNVRVSSGKFVEDLKPAAGPSPAQDPGLERDRERENTIDFYLHRHSYEGSLK